MHAVHTRAGDIGPHGQPLTEAFDSAGDLDNPKREWEYAVDGYVDHAARAQRLAEDVLRQRIGKDNPGLDDWRFIVRRRPPTPTPYGS